MKAPDTIMIEGAPKRLSTCPHEKAAHWPLFLCRKQSPCDDDFMSRFKRPSGGKPPPSEGPSLKPPSTAFKIKLRGKDGAPLSMPELRQGLFDIAHKLAPYEGWRAKWVTVYLTMVDENGQEMRINRKGEWTLYPYKSAADEHGA